MITKSSAPSAAVIAPCVPSPSRSVLPPPNTHSSPVDEQVLLDLRPEIGVAEPDPVADGRAEQLGVLRAATSRVAITRSAPMKPPSRARSSAPLEASPMRVGPRSGR